MTFRLARVLALLNLQRDRDDGVAQQQGSEGLENLRAALVVGWSTRV